MSSIPLPALSINPQPNVLDQYSKLAALQNNQQESQLRQQQIQEGQQNLAARKALNDAYSGAITTGDDGKPTLDTDKLTAGLANTPAAYQTPEVMKNITAFQKSNVDLQSAKMDLQSKQKEMLANAAAAVKAANYDPTLTHSLIDSLPPSPEVQQLRSVVGNPQMLKQVVDAALQSSPKQRELATNETTANARAAAAKVEADKFAATKDPTSSLYAPSQAAVAMGTAPGAAQIQSGEVAQAAAKAGAEEKARMPGEMALAAQRQALSQGNPNAAAQLLVNGDATLAELKSRGATPEFIANTLNAAHQLSGGKYNAQAADAQFDVAKSPENVRFFGSAKSLTDPGGTLDQLAKVGSTIPGNQIPAFNSIADWEKAETGSGSIAKYAAQVVNVADDYAKVMGGGVGSDSSRNQAAQLIGAARSPEQRAAAIEGIRGGVTSQAVSRIGDNPVLKRMYGSNLQPQQQAAPSPQTHTFSLSAWQRANPKGDANAAKTAATQQGYQVVQ